MKFKKRERPLVDKAKEARVARTILNEDSECKEYTFINCFNIFESVWDA